MTEKLFLIEKQDLRNPPGPWALLEIAQTGADILEKIIGFTLKEPEDFKPGIYERIKIEVTVIENNILLEKADGLTLIIKKDPFMQRTKKAKRRFRKTKFTMYEVSAFLFRDIVKNP